MKICKVNYKYTQMYNHFVCQLTDARPINKNKRKKQYKKQLNSINKQRNFIVLRSLYGGDYEAEMKRSMILANLQYIHENLCFESGIRPSNPYRGMRPINFTNKKITIMPRLWRQVFFKRRFNRTYLCKLRTN